MKAMSIHLNTQNFRQGSAGFSARLDFTLNGYSGSYLGQTWAAKIVCPDGIILSKTTGIEFLQDTNKISIPIDDFDLIKAGTYYYQVTLKTGGTNINSTVESFDVIGSLPEGLSYTVSTSTLNHFAIFASGGAITASNLIVDGDTDLSYAGGAKFTGAVKIPDEVYGVSWNGKLEAPTKNALYDYLSTFTGTGFSGTEGSIPYADVSGTLTEDNNNLFYSEDDTKLLLWNKNFRNFSGANAVLAIGDLHPQYNGDTYRDIGLEEIPNTLANFETGGPYYADKYFVDVEPVVTCNNGKGAYGITSILYGRATSDGGRLIGGTFGANSYGNKQSTYTGNLSLTGLSSFVYVRSQNEIKATGLDVQVFTGGNLGGTNTTPLYGIYNYVAGGHNGTTPLQVNAQFVNSNLGGGGNGTITEGVGLELIFDSSPSVTDFTTAYGIAIRNWKDGSDNITPNGGRIHNAYGIYIDTTIDKATVSKYAIYSLSTSPTFLSGRLEIRKTSEQLRLSYDTSNYMSITTGAIGSTTFALTSGGVPTFTFSQKTTFTDGAFAGSASAYNAATWDGSLEYATKDAIRDKIEGLILGTGSFVDLSTDQTIAGHKVFTDYLTVTNIFGVFNSTSSGGDINVFANDGDVDGNSGGDGTFGGGNGGSGNVNFDGGIGGEAILFGGIGGIGGTFGNGGRGGDVEILSGIGGNATGSNTVGSGGNILIKPGAKGTGGAGGGTDGQIRFYKINSSTYAAFAQSSLTANRTFTFPDVTGILALTNFVISPLTGTVTVNSSDTGKVYTNEGATNLTTFNLPTAVAGLNYTFYVQDSDGIRVVANSGDTLRINNSVSATAGRIDSTTIGSVVTIVAVNATEWVARNSSGTWTVT